MINNTETRNPNELKENQYSRELFPALEGKQYEILRDDIKENGIQAPVEITKDNVILRGHERVKIALEIGLTSIPTKVFASDDITEQKIEVIKDNLARKSLDFNTKYKVFVELKQLYGIKHGDTLKRGQYLPEASSESLEKMSEEEIAKEVGLNEATFHRAQAVQKSDLPTKIKEAVFKGELPVRPILDILDKPETIKKEIMEKIENKLTQHPEIEIQVAPIVRAVESKYKAAKIEETVVPSEKEELIEQSDTIKQVLGMLQIQNLKCPICGETKIAWKCGHEFS